MSPSRSPNASLARAAILPFLLLAAPLSGAAQAGPSGDAGTERILPLPVEPPAPFEAALAAGTRSDTGLPGASYWQQEADYTIQAELDPSTGRIEGRQVIRYGNRSPETLESVVLHLDQNVFAEGARRNRRAPVTGGFELERIRVDGQSVPNRHVGSSYYEALTLLQVGLPTPLEPGQDVEIEMAWSFVVPPAPTFRNGNRDGRNFAVAQWYPRMAVYDDVYGWNLEPYLGDGEFYLEYGDYDVEITLPAGWIVGATGTLQNPTEVLAPEAAERLASARSSDGVTRIVDEEEVGSGTAPGNDAETLTWRFTATGVRDFAWAASPDFVWDAAGVEVPGTGSRTLLQAFYRPDLDAWNRGVEYLAHAVRTLSEWIGPYPYPSLAIAETSVGGMEYPMFIFNPATNSDTGLAGVTVHEAAHQWFPMVVGTMEAKHAWMDEGIGSYWEDVSLAAFYGSGPIRWGETSSYLQVAGTEDEVPIMRHTDLVSPYGARTLAAYTKPAVMLGALRDVMGAEAFEAGFRDFFESWSYRHPQPWDFFHTMERHHGEDLDWFWRPFFFETHTLDHAVASVESDGRSATIRIEDRGLAVAPTPVGLVMEDGSRTEERIPVDVWLEGARSYELTVYGAVAEVVLDPAGIYPDVERTNNRWVAP